MLTRIWFQAKIPFHVHSVTGPAIFFLLCRKFVSNIFCIYEQLCEIGPSHLGDLFPRLPSSSLDRTLQRTRSCASQVPQCTHSINKNLQPTTIIDGLFILQAGKTLYKSRRFFLHLNGSLAMQQRRKKKLPFYRNV